MPLRRDGATGRDTPARRDPGAVTATEPAADTVVVVDEMNATQPALIAIAMAIDNAPTCVERLAGLRVMQQTAGERIDTEIDEAHAAGMTWVAIADPLGVSPQAVQQRWARRARLASPQPVTPDTEATVDATAAVPRGAARRSPPRAAAGPAASDVLTITTPGGRTLLRVRRS